MSTLTNTTDHVVAYRDDCAEKHVVEPGEQVTIHGDQHLPMIRPLMHGTGEARTQGGDEPAEDPAAQPTGEAGSRPRKRRGGGL